MCYRNKLNRKAVLLQFVESDLCKYCLVVCCCFSSRLVNGYDDTLQLWRGPVWYQLQLLWSVVFPSVSFLNQEANLMYFMAPIFWDQLFKHAPQVLIKSLSHYFHLILINIDTPLFMIWDNLKSICNYFGKVQKI